MKNDLKDSIHRDFVENRWIRFLRHLLPKLQNDMYKFSSGKQLIDEKEFKRQHM